MLLKKLNMNMLSKTLFLISFKGDTIVDKHITQHTEQSQ